LSSSSPAAIDIIKENAVIRFLHSYHHRLIRRQSFDIQAADKNFVLVRIGC